MNKLITVISSFTMASALSGCVSGLTNDCANGNMIQCQYLVDKCNEGDQEYCKAVDTASKQLAFYNSHPEILAMKQQQQAIANQQTNQIIQCSASGGTWDGSSCYHQPQPTYAAPSPQMPVTCHKMGNSVTCM